MTNLQINPQSSSRLEYVDIAKAISIILIVFLHSTTIAASLGSAAEKFVFVNAQLTPIRVPLFFIASGFFARKTATGDLNRFLSRVLRLVWVFAIWQIISFCFFKFVVDRPDLPLADADFLEFLRQFLTPELIWFIWALAVFFVLARICMAIAPVPSLLISGTAAIFAMTYPDALPFAEVRVVRNSLMYFVFFLLPIVFPAIRTYLTNVRLASAVAIALVLYLAFGAGSFWMPGEALSGVRRMAQSICGVTLLLLVSRAISLWRLPARIFNYLGQRTLPIYVIHSLIVSSLAVAMATARPPLGQLTSYVWVLTMALVGIGVSLSIAFLFERAGMYWLFELPRQWKARLLEPSKRPPGISASS